ncbi:TPA: hypothetical protein OHP13_000975 [Escherichia coli]|nr:hypothetical protein [Escherichia coli]
MMTSLLPCVKGTLMVPLSFLSKDPRHWRVFCARKTAQNIKRAGGCEYWPFSLLAFSTRVIGMSR